MTSITTSAHVSRKLSVREAHEALDANRFEMWFQPIVCLSTLEVLSFEGLARLRADDGGVISPAAFISTVEADRVLYQRFTDRMIEKAIDFVVGCRSAGAETQVTVNLAEASMRDEHLVPRVEALLNHHGVAPKQLMFEITEREFIDPESAQSEVLHGLSKLGVGLAIDDFGTGWSSLDALRWLPLSQLKVDGCFLDRIAANAADRIIVEKVIELAHSLHLLVVAEGIERSDQLEILRAAGCGRGQGFLFSPAVEPTAAIELAAAGAIAAPCGGQEAASSLTDNDTGAATPFRVETDAACIGDVIDDQSALGSLALLALDVLPMAVFIKALDGRIVWSNDYHWRHLGATCRDDVVDLGDLALHRVDEALRYRYDDLTVLATGTAVIDRVEYQTSPEGTRCTLQTSKYPVRNRGGAVVGLIGFYSVQDVATPGG